MNSKINAESGRFGDYPRLEGIVVGNEGNIFVNDSGRRIIWKIKKEGSLSSYVGGGQFLYSENLDACNHLARFYSPHSLVISSQNFLYVADSSMVRKVNPEGCVSTLQIEGKSEPIFGTIFDLALDEAKNILYILSENKVYKLDLNARAPS
ncbi:MAG: hypothetical protein IV090_00005 [Candidatus Sericytochromatia bacterium]|nr:hypothetical protein [Candidatus Sericytochromatia bacterium]